MNEYFDYIKKVIIEIVSETTDDDLLKYIYTMLMTAITAEKHQEDS